MRSIPLIDLSGTASVVHEIESACRDVGFMYIAGHGIAPNIVAAARTAVINYFALPLQQKNAAQITADNYRGYIPLGFFSYFSPFSDE